ncbi:MAG: ankyrin repeat domain-containing protein [Planctomycetota bacterium]|nr:ankyrin repeat domain-containing protein [Planctomycetota bacterium]
MRNARDTLEAELRRIHLRLGMYLLGADLLGGLNAFVWSYLLACRHHRVPYDGALHGVGPFTDWLVDVKRIGIAKNIGWVGLIAMAYADPQERFESFFRFYGEFTQNNLAFCTAAYHGDIERVRTLLLCEKEPDVDFALCEALNNHQVGMAHLLIEAGAVVDAALPWGNRPLILAIAAEAKMMKTGELATASLVGVLLERGAPMDQKGLRGETPLVYAREVGHRQAESLLMQRGATA